MGIRKQLDSQGLAHKAWPKVSPKVKSRPIKKPPSQVLSGGWMYGVYGMCPQPHAAQGSVASRPQQTWV